MEKGEGAGPWSSESAGDRHGVSFVMVPSNQPQRITVTLMLSHSTTLVRKLSGVGLGDERTCEVM